MSDFLRRKTDKIVKIKIYQNFLNGSFVGLVVVTFQATERQIYPACL